MPHVLVERALLCTFELVLGGSISRVFTDLAALGLAKDLMIYERAFAPGPTRGCRFWTG